MVAVGTAVAGRPPHRSRRALLTHRAPPTGSGVEAVTGQRVYGSDWRKEAGDELNEPLPTEACCLAAPLERCEPEPLHLVEETPQARVVTRDCEVVQMPFQHLFHPSTGFSRWGRAPWGTFTSFSSSFPGTPDRVKPEVSARLLGVCFCPDQRTSSGRLCMCENLHISRLRDSADGGSIAALAIC
jgi:hypothetical protein